MSTSNLSSIQFLTKAQYDTITPSDDNLYAVECVQQWQSGESFYWKFADGRIIQGGVKQLSGTETWTNFYLPFSSGYSYAMQVTRIGGNAQTGFSTGSNTGTTLYCSTSGAHVSWVAFGR